MAACNGADLATVIQPLDRAPVRIITGPFDLVSAGDLEKATYAYYRSLLRGGDGSAALRAIGDALNNRGTPFLTVSAEGLFLQILQLYYNEGTTDEQIAVRVERMIARAILAGASSAEISHRRAFFENFLRDREALFDACYRRFFFVDEYPENANRFVMSFERCFQETATTSEPESAP